MEALSYDEEKLDLLTDLKALRKRAEKMNLNYKKVYEKQNNKQYQVKARYILEGQNIYIENNYKVGSNPKLQPLYISAYKVLSTDNERRNVIYLYWEKGKGCSHK